MTVGLKLPVVVVVGSMIGISQVQLGIDTTKVRNDIFELKQMLKKKDLDSHE